MISQPAELVLASGEIFPGFSPFPLSTPSYGEIVFNTGMVGYVEMLTDPSYRGQIINFTFPLMGNYGVPNNERWESNALQAFGMIANEIAPESFHHEQTNTLLHWCNENNLPTLTGIDTRALTMILRQKGVVSGVIRAKGDKSNDFIDFNERHLVKEVSIKQPELLNKKKGKRIVVVDCGIKNSILRHLLTFDCEILCVPFDYDVTQEKYDGVLLSNGPGDPVRAPEIIETVKKLVDGDKPIFGICLGAQICALALGAKTYKLPFGHRAQNHSCMHLETQRCYLTSQNHGYAIDEKTLPKNWQVMFRHLTDNTVQGIKHESKPMFAVQFHPEAAPGPVDTAWLFKKFIESL